MKRFTEAPMDIRIDKQRLLDCISGKQREWRGPAAEAKIKELARALADGPPSAFLLSGYRGAGKTYFVNQVQETLKDQQAEKILFVTINFAAYQEKKHLFRWMIRELHLCITNSTALEKILIAQKDGESGKEILTQMKRLYEKTFFEETLTTTQSRKVSGNWDLNIDLARLIMVLFGIAGAGLILLSTVFSITANPLPQIISSGIAFLGLIGSLFALKRSISKSQTEQADITQKSLFDDEIADYHFVRLLKGLATLGFKVVMVLDEMDKVENDRVTGFFKELKPLLLAGHAHFIVVAGQDLYYRYRQAQTEDDALLSSIFSKLIHVSLFTRNDFHNMGRMLTGNSDNAKNEGDTLLKLYIDKLTFLSIRTPRKFFHLLNSDLQWSADYCTLRINDPLDHLEYFGNLMECIDVVEEKYILTEDFDSPEHDYLLMQVLLASLCIDQNKHAEFNSGTFIHKEGDDIGMVDARVYLKFIKRVSGFNQSNIERLLTELSKEGIIDKKDNSSSSYHLRKSSRRYIQHLENTENVNYMQLFELKNVATNIALKLGYAQQQEIGHLKFSKVLQTLVDRSAFKAGFLKNEKAVYGLDQLEELVRDNQSGESLSRIMEDHRIHPIDLASQALEFYCRQKAAHFFKAYDYFIEDGVQTAGFDYQLRGHNYYFLRLLFDIRYRKGDIFRDKRFIQSIVSRLSKLDEHAFVFVIVFGDANNIKPQAMQLRFQDAMEEMNINEDMRDKVSLLPVNTNSLDMLEQGFREFVEKNIIQVIDRVFTSQPAPISHPGRNDDFLPTLFDFKKYDFEIQITPQETNFWRFGFRFSETAEFPPRDQERHENENIVDIHLCAGDGIQTTSGSYVWTNPGLLTLAAYHTRPSAEKQNSSGYSKETVNLKMTSNLEGSEVIVSYEIGQQLMGMKIFVLKRFRYCQLVAWCDESPFRLNARITVRRKK